MLLNQLNTTVDGQFQRYASSAARTSATTSSVPTRGCASWSPHLSDEDLRQPAARRARLPQALRGVQGGDREPRLGRADGHPVQDDQGLDARPGLRGPQRHPPDQEDEQGAAARPARPAVPARRDPRRRALDGDEPPYYRPPEDSIEYQYMMERRRALGGSIPKRIVRHAQPIELPDDDVVRRAARRLGQAGRVDHDGLHPPAAQPRPRPEVRAARRADHPRRGPHVRHGLAVPRAEDLRIAAARSTSRSTTTCCSSYTEAADGQILEEGITEAGSMASFIAAGTAYATRGVPMVPFYTFYSMFGFQRVGDLIWQAADARTRGFLLGATAGRTTLLGEGLQHQDGHSLVLGLARCRRARPTTRRSPTRSRRSCEPGIERMYGRRVRSRPRRLLLHHPVQRELPDAGDARRACRPDATSCAACTAGGGARRPADQGDDPVQRLAAAAPPREAASELAERLRRRRRAVVGDVVQGAARGGPDAPSGGTGCTPASRRAPRSSPSCSATAPARSSPSPTS